MVRLVQHCPYSNRKSENLAVVQSTRLDISAGLQYAQESEEVGSNASEGLDLPVREGKQAKNRDFLLQCPFYGCHRKV